MYPKATKVLPLALECIYYLDYLNYIFWDILHFPFNPMVITNACDSLNFKNKVLELVLSYFVETIGMYIVDV